MLEFGGVTEAAFGECDRVERWGVEAAGDPPQPAPTTCGLCEQRLPGLGSAAMRHWCGSIDGARQLDAPVLVAGGDDGFHDLEDVEREVCGGSMRSVGGDCVSHVCQSKPSAGIE